MKFLKIESYRSGFIISTGLNILAKGLAFFNVIIVAHYFGSNSTTDVYFAILSVALIITTTINSIDSLVLIPEAIRLKEQVNPEASQKFVNFFLLCYTVIGLLIAGIILISPSFFYSLFTSFDSDLLTKNTSLLLLSGPLICFQIINNLLNSVLTSYKYFTISILTGFVNSIFSLTLTIVFHSRLGVEGTVLGLVLGGLINFILLNLVLIKYQSWCFSKIAWVKDHAIWTSISLMHLNIFPLWLRNSIGLYLLSGLGTGIVTSLNFGQQLASLPDVLIVSQLIAVAGIKFAELFSQKNEIEANTTFIKLSEWGVSITSFIGFFLFLFSREIVHILYLNSNISDKSAENTVLAFSMLLFSLPARFNAALCTLLLTASQNVKSTFIFTFGTHILITIVLVFLIRQYGLLGYLIGFNLHFYIFLIVFYPILKKVLPYMEYTLVFEQFIRNIVSNSIVCLAVLGLLRLLPGESENSFIRLILGFILYLPFMFVCNNFTKANKYLTYREIHDYAKRKIFAKVN